MAYFDVHRSTLIALLTLSVGCADDGQTDDDVASDTEDSTGDSSGSEGESGSSDDMFSTDTVDGTETSEGTESDGTSSTDDATESTDDTTESTTDDTTESTTDTAESTTDTADTNDTGEEIMCPDVFPAFDKSCSTDDDCAVVVHTTDCCGNSVALGINQSEVDAFAAAEAICDSQYPPCGCPQGPTVAEDGNAVFDPDDLAVECSMGSCSSYVL